MHIDPFLAVYIMVYIPLVVARQRNLTDIGGVCPTVALASPQIPIIYKLLIVHIRQDDAQLTCGLPRLGNADLIFSCRFHLTQAALVAAIAKLVPVYEVGCECNRLSLPTILTVCQCLLIEVLF